MMVVPIHGGDDLAGGLRLGHFGYAGIVAALTALDTDEFAGAGER